MLEEFGNLWDYHARGKVIAITTNSALSDVLEGYVTVKKKYWLFVTRYSCVLCGRVREYRERRYSRKPKSYAARREDHDTACCDHF